MDGETREPRQKSLSVAPGTYQRVTELKNELSKREERNLNYSELLDRMVKNYRATHEDLS